jgi:hypothetical protein
MIPQLVEVNDEMVFISDKPKTWYKFYCNKCGCAGQTLRRNFQCCDGYTRITLAELEGE